LPAYLFGFAFGLQLGISFLYGLTAPSPPVETTAAEDQNQNNDYKYDFHDVSSFFFERLLILFNSISCAGTCDERKGSLRL